MRYVRENVKKIVPYKPVNISIKYGLDANESPYNINDQLTLEDYKFLLNNQINKYPDGNSQSMIDSISAYVSIPSENILCGNGSDELLKIVFDTVIGGGDKVLTHSPSFSQYRLNSHINDGYFIEVASDQDYQLDMATFISRVQQEKPNLVLLCNPNNPTGTIVERDDIIRLLHSTDALVVVDEAYMDFSTKSVLDLGNKYPNLVVMRTLSKAFGLAGIRLGYLVSSVENIDYFNRVRMPYNVNRLTTSLAQLALQKRSYNESSVQKIVAERDRLYDLLSQQTSLNVIKSHTNFLLIKSDYSDEINKALLEKDIKIRVFNKAVLENSIRITINERLVNDIVVSTIMEVING